MTPEQIIAALWRRRRLLAATFVICLAIVILLVAVLPRSYRATATLFVDGPTSDAQAAEQLTRTYAALAGNPNVAEQARHELPFAISRRKLLEHMSFVPVERTQLIEVNAEFSTKARAQAVANVYSRVFARRVQARNGTGTIAVSELATRPNGAVRPNPPLYLAFGLVLSLLLGIAAALVRDALDRRVRVTERDVDLHGAPILARVPRPRGGAAGAARMQDGYRLARAAIDLRGDGPRDVVALIPSEAGRGEESAAVRMATVAASDGEHVVLVEADLRRPQLDAALQQLGWRGRSERGLRDVLAGDTDEEAVLAADPSTPRLEVLWAGRPVANAGAMLASPGFPALLRRLAQHFDRVVIAAPPVAVGADAATLAAASDATVLVVDAERTTDDAASAHIDHLRAFRAPGLGVVVVNADVAAEPGYYEREQPPAPRPRQARRAQAQEVPAPADDARR